VQSRLARHSEDSFLSVDDLLRHSQRLFLAFNQAEAVGLAHEVNGLLSELRETELFQFAALALHNPDRKTVALLSQSGESRNLLGTPISSAFLALAIDLRQSIEVHDAAIESKFRDLAQSMKMNGIQSFRIVPVSTQRHTHGALILGRNQAGEFAAEHIIRSNETAQRVALMLENSLITDLLFSHQERLGTLFDVNTVLATTLNIREIFEQVSSTLRRLVPGEYTCLAVYNKPADAMNIHFLDSENRPIPSLSDNAVPATECPAGIAHRQDTVMLFNHSDLQLLNSQYSRNLLAQGIRSMCHLPLISRNKNLGTLGLASLTDDAIPEDDVMLLTQIASQVALAIDNARAHDEIARYKDRFSKEKRYLEDEISAQHNFGEVIGNSAALCQTLRQVEIAAPSDATVLVLGETGTGKELIARSVHRLSSRREGNFIKLNCAAIPTGLLESELFGHEKGAFTGAVSQKLERIELADKGTLFLDEIGEIPMDLQPKLLRVLQDHEFERLGGVKTIRVNVRLVAATNRDLTQAVNERQFRSDLFYRLNVFLIRVPPLRERTGDIPMLVQYFVQKFARRMGKHVESIPAELIREFESWDWPGNIRELENFIERSVILTQGSVFFAPMAELRGSSPERSQKSGTLEEVEREYILLSLREAAGVVAGPRGAAARLGMKRTTLQSRIQKLGIVREEYET
jgi:formate hydrogenlyase transcriptional activator